MQLLISPERRARIKNHMQNNKSGIIKMAVMIVIGIVIISILGFDIRKAMENEQTQANFSYLGQGIAWSWNTYIDEYWDVAYKFFGPMMEDMWGNAKEFEYEDFKVGQQDFLENVPTLDLQTQAQSNATATASSTN